MMQKVAMFGMGYVGCVTAACLVRDGHHVMGVDVDPGKIAELNAGVPPVLEPDLAPLIKEQVGKGALTATADVEKAVGWSDIAMISVGTPSEENGAVSTRSVEGVIESIGRSIRRFERRSFIVVVRSTLLPGILEDRLAPILEDAAGRHLGDHLWLGNNPEFLRESSAIRDYDHPPFVIVGADDPVPARTILKLYDRIEAERIVTDSRTAAMVKYACNAFHALKVAFANEIGCLSKAFGADGHRIMDLLCRDRKLNISPAYLRPGFAFGGSCLPKDVRAINRCADEMALRLDVLKSILPSNEAQIQRALAMVQKTGQKRVGMVGLSFKALTDDLRESPLVILAETLLGRGYDIRIYDPEVTVSRLRGRNLAYVDLHLPHLASLLVDKPSDLYEHASLLVLGSNVADNLDGLEEFTGPILDLQRDLAQPATRSTALAATKNGSA
jgi:GDP-mannose 6-dehydrogenase